MRRRRGAAAERLPRSASRGAGGAPARGAERAGADADGAALRRGRWRGAEARGRRAGGRARRAGGADPGSPLESRPAGHRRHDHHRDRGGRRDRDRARRARTPTGAAARSRARPRARREPARHPLVERRGELGAGHAAARRRAAAPARPARRARGRPPRRPASRRSPRATRRSRGRSGIVNASASQAFLSFSIVRYSSVPAFDSLTPSTRASSALRQAGVELERDDLALARGQLRPARRATAVRRSATSAPSSTVRRGARPPARSTSVATPPAPAQLVERGVARDPEQPRALLAAAAVERAPAPVGALERERGDVLGGRAVAQQRRRRRRTRRRGSSGRAPRTAPTSSGLGAIGRASGESRSHPHYEPASNPSRASICVDSMRASLGCNAYWRCAVARGGARGRREPPAQPAPQPDPGPDPRRRSSRPSAPSSLWATVNICNTKRYPDTLGIRGQMPASGSRPALSMKIQLDYWTRHDKRFVPLPTGGSQRLALGRSATELQQDGVDFDASTARRCCSTRAGQFMLEARTASVLGRDHADAPPPATRAPDFGRPARTTAPRTLHDPAEARRQPAPRTAAGRW